jgi:hypothetical protein
MVRRGGADAGRLGGGCTHVVACGRVYMSPALRLALLLTFRSPFFSGDLEPIWLSLSLCMCVCRMSTNNLAES